MPAIRPVAQRRPADAIAPRRSERLRQTAPAPAASRAPAPARLRPLRERPPQCNILGALLPPNPDHVHAAQAKYGHLNPAFDYPPALSTIGHISTDNQRLTQQLPKMRIDLYSLVLQCLPMARLEGLHPAFKQRRAELHRLLDHVAKLHGTALTIEDRLLWCVQSVAYQDLVAIAREFRELMEQTQGAWQSQQALQASLERHLIEIKQTYGVVPPIIAPWHLLEPLAVPAARLAGEQCALSMTDAADILEPLVLPVGQRLQLYSRIELEMWLQTSRRHNIRQYMFLNPTTNVWEKLSALRRLVITPDP